MRSQFASSLRQHNWYERQRDGNALRFAPALTGPQKLQGAHLEGAEYDAEIVFPQGFDSKNHRMVFKS